MKRHLLAGLTLAGTALLAAACANNADSAPPASESAQPAAAPAAQPASAGAAASTRTDYGDTANWLCRPGQADDACKVNIDATIIEADGSTRVETFAHNPDAPIDCFYVYPTVSLDPMTYSDLKPGPEEFSVVRSQLARFGSQCRLFAPMYRQFSLGALRARMSGGGNVPVNGTPADPNNDIDDAWAWYMANENKGRGVVIIGHSQGSGQIMRLIASQVDGQPAQQHLVSALVLGMSAQVPPGADTGGTFKSIPVCKSADQFGCVVSYSTFRETLPPSPTANFGIGRDGNEAICTNPAALGGGESTAPKAYFSTGDKEWVKGKTIETPFVMTPGLIATECVKRGDHHYLEMRIRPAPGDVRTDDPGTDVMANGAPDAGWGLHLIDANVGMGDLVELVGRQGAAWAARN